jgi:hypothetical protein
MRFSVAFHHGGNFVRDWIICYKGGDKAIFKVKDDDDWGYAEMCGLVEDDLKVSKGYRLWWMHDEDINFRLVRLDEDAYAVKDYAVSNNCVANIYVEHDVGETSGLVDVPNFVNTTQGCDSSQVIDTEKGKNVVVASDNEKDDDIAEDDDDFSSSEDEAKGVTFDDSEDERGLGLEDGFEVPYAEPKNGTNRVIVEGKSYRVKHRANKNPTPTKKTQTPKKKSSTNCDPEWEKDYMSEELNSDDPDDSDKEGGSKALTFNMDHLNKDTDFNFGMDFKSLHDFKEAIREWSILNGRETKYLKNDKIRCRIGRVEHRLCLRHLYANFKKKFGGGTLIRDLMMGAAKATYIQAWQVKMNELRKADLKAWSGYQMCLLNYGVSMPFPFILSVMY